MKTDLVPSSIDEAVNLSKLLAQSSLVPTSYKNNVPDIFAAIAWGSEVNMKPMQALQGICVINGKPSIYGDAAIAMCLASGLLEDIEETIDDKLDGGTAICKVKRKAMKTAKVFTFSMKDASNANLLGRGPWKSYPKRMLQMRARGFALRDMFSDVLRGMITVEEAEDYEAVATKDITPEASKQNKSTNPLNALENKPAEKEAEKIVLHTLKGSENFKTMEDAIEKYKTYEDRITNMEATPELKQERKKKLRSMNPDIYQALCQAIDLTLPADGESDQVASGHHPKSIAEVAQKILANPQS